MKNSNNIKSMSMKEMECTIHEILTDNGMDDDTANKTVLSMSINDMEQFLLDAGEDE